MIKVCHMTSAHGVEDVRIFHKECVSLAQAGYEVYLVERGESYDKNGVHIVGVGEIPSNRFKRMTQGARRVYETALALDCDIYHLHDPELLPYGLKLKKKGKKVIFDSHENYTEQIKTKPYLPEAVSKAASVVYATYEKYAFSKIDGLIHTCLKLGVDPYCGMCRNIAVINNYPSKEVFNKYTPQVVKKKRSVCYVGALSHERGITELIKAAALADCKVYLAGRFTSAEYEKYVLTLPEFKSNGSYVGVLNRDEIADFIQSCEIGMATLLNVGQYNQDDSLPTKVYEYMALGIPSIISKSLYNERTMDLLKVGLCVDPDDSEAIAKGMLYILNNPEMAKKMGEAGRSVVENTMNWEFEKEKLFKFYESVSALAGERNDK